MRRAHAISLTIVVLAAACCSQGRGGTGSADASDASGSGTAELGSSSAPLGSARHRGLYVTEIGAILDDQDAVERLFAAVGADHFDRLTLYGLGNVFDDPRAADLLVRLIQRAREEGVTSIAAPIAGVDRIRRVVAWNEAHPDRAFDAMITEDEYWNRCAERDVTAVEGVRGDCFPAFAALIEEIRTAAAGEIAAGRPMRVGVYLGYPTGAEAERIASLVDEVHLNYPVGDPREAWSEIHPRGGALSERFGWFAATSAEIWPIFYLRGEVDMRDWIEANGLAAAEDVFLRDAAAAGVRVRLGGFQYFTFDR